MTHIRFLLPPASTPWLLRLTLSLHSDRPPYCYILSYYFFVLPHVRARAPRSRKNFFAEDEKEKKQQQWRPIFPHSSPPPLFPPPNIVCPNSRVPIFDLRGLSFYYAPTLLFPLRKTLSSNYIFTEKEKRIKNFPCFLWSFLFLLSLVLLTRPRTLIPSCD